MPPLSRYRSPNCAGAKVDCRSPVTEVPKLLREDLSHRLLRAQNGVLPVSEGDDESSAFANGGACTEPQPLKEADRR